MRPSEESHSLHGILSECRRLWQSDWITKVIQKDLIGLLMPRSALRLLVLGKAHYYQKNKEKNIQDLKQQAIMILFSRHTNSQQTQNQCPVKQDMKWSKKFKQSYTSIQTTTQINNQFHLPIINKNGNSIKIMQKEKKNHSSMRLVLQVQKQIASKSI